MGLINILHIHILYCILMLFTASYYWIKMLSKSKTRKYMAQQYCKYFLQLQTGYYCIAETSIKFSELDSKGSIWTLFPYQALYNHFPTKTSNSANGLAMERRERETVKSLTQSLHQATAPYQEEKFTLCHLRGHNKTSNTLPQPSWKHMRLVWCTGPIGP